MIEIIYRDKRFLVKGSFSIGIAGNYVNEDFGDENIMINDTLEEIMKELQDEDSFWYKPLFPYLKSETADSGGIARGLTAYYNQKEKEIRENEKQINDCILYRLFSDLTGSGYPFWEIEQAVIPGRMKNGGGSSGKKKYTQKKQPKFSSGLMNSTAYPIKEPWIKQMWKKGLGNCFPCSTLKGWLRP